MLYNFYNKKKIKSVLPDIKKKETKVEKSYNNFQPQLLKIFRAI